MSLRVRSVLLTVLVVCGIAVAGCGGSSSSGGKTSTAGGAKPKAVNIGVVLPPTTNEYWRAMEDGVRFEASRLGADVMVQTTTDYSAEEAVAKLQDMLTKGANAIFVVAYDPGFQPILDRAIAQGIPVVCADSCVPRWTRYTSFVRTNNLLAGQIAGRFISDVTRGKGTVGMISCTVAITSCADRNRGVKSALAPSLRVFGPIGDACDQEHGVTYAQNVMTAAKGLSAIFTGCDQLALAADRVGAGKVPVVGIDGASEALAAIQAGQQLATVAQFPIKMGEIGVRQIVAAVRGGSVTKDIDSGAELVTKKNVADFVAKNSVPQ